MRHPILLWFLLAPSFAFAQVLMQEDFSASSDPFPPRGWSNLASQPGYSLGFWEFAPLRQAKPLLFSSISGGDFDSSFAFLEAHQHGPNNRINALLESPSISTMGHSNLVLRWSECFMSYPGDEGVIEYSLDGGNTWLFLIRNTRDVGLPRVGGPSIAVKRVLTLPPTTANQNDLRLRFRYSGLYGNFWAIDHIRLMVNNNVDIQLRAILQTGLCPPPDSLFPQVSIENGGNATSCVVGFALGQDTVRDTINSLPRFRTTFWNFSKGLPKPSQSGSFTVFVQSALDLDKSDDTLVGRFSTIPAFHFQDIHFDRPVSNNPGEVLGAWETWRNALQMPQTTKMEGLHPIAPDVLQISLWQGNASTWLSHARAFRVDHSGTLEIRYAFNQANTLAPALPRADDQFLLKLSKDCGDTWQTVDTLPRGDSTGVFMTHRLGLDSLKGQNLYFAVQIGLGSSTQSLYDFNIDYIRLDYGHKAELDLIDWQSTGPLLCPDDTLLRFTARNKGSQSLFQQAIAFQVNGQSPDTVVLNQGIGPGNKAVLTLPLPSSYWQPDTTLRIRAYCLVDGDSIQANDTLPLLTLKTYRDRLPPLDFGQYSGGKLAKAHPGWQNLERPGAAVGGAWQASSTGQNTQFGTQGASFHFHNSGIMGSISSDAFAVQQQTSLRWQMALHQPDDPMQVGQLGPDDSLLVLAELPCAARVDTLFQWAGTGYPCMSQDSFSADLSAYRGQRIKLHFYASTGVKADAMEGELFLSKIGLDTSLGQNLSLDVLHYHFPQPCSQDSLLRFHYQVRNTGMQSLGDSLELRLGGQLIKRVQVPSLQANQQRVFSDSLALPLFSTSLVLALGPDQAMEDNQLNLPIPTNPVGQLPKEDFDNLQPNIIGTGFAQDWSTSPLRQIFSYKWVIQNGTSPSDSTGPLGDASGNGLYAFVEASHGRAGDQAILTTPCFGLGQANGLQVNFAFHGFGKDLHQFFVQALDAQGKWQTFGQLSGQTHAAMASAWRDTSFFLGQLKDQSQVRLVAIRGGGFQGDWALDNLEIKLLPDTSLALTLEKDQFSLACDTLMLKRWGQNQGAFSLNNAKWSLFTGDSTWKESLRRPLATGQKAFGSSGNAQWLLTKKPKDFRYQISLWSDVPGPGGQMPNVKSLESGLARVFPRLDPVTYQGDNQRLWQTQAWAAIEHKTDSLGPHHNLSQAALQKHNGRFLAFQNTDWLVLPSNGKTHGLFLASPLFQTYQADRLSLLLGVVDTAFQVSGQDSVSFLAFWQDHCSDTLQSLDTFLLSDFRNYALQLPAKRKGRLYLQAHDSSGGMNLLIGEMRLLPQEQRDLVLEGLGTATGKYEDGETLRFWVSNRGQQSIGNVDLVSTLNGQTTTTPIGSLSPGTGRQAIDVGPINLSGNQALEICAHLAYGTLDEAPQNDSLCTTWKIGGLNPSLHLRQEGSVADIRVYPNPVRSTLHLELPPSKNAYTLRLCDLHGRTLYSQVTRDGLYSLAMDAYSAGLYLLHIHSEQGVATFQLVVE